jgi:hypothetical protein
MYVSTGSAFNGRERGSHAGNIFVMLRDLEGSKTSSYEVVQRVQEKVGEMPEAEKLLCFQKDTSKLLCLRR